GSRPSTTSICSPRRRLSTSSRTSSWPGAERRIAPAAALTTTSPGGPKFVTRRPSAPPPSRGRWVGHDPEGGLRQTPTALVRTDCSSDPPPAFGLLPREGGGAIT